jgi:hypothetical protein
MTVGRAPLTYPAALLPRGFRYPQAFLTFRADVAACDLFPGSSSIQNVRPANC